MNKPLLKNGADWSDEDYIAYWKSRCMFPGSGCWLWTGFQVSFRNQKPGQPGYAEAGYRGKKVRLHRKMLEFKLGRPLGPKMQSCHDCDTPNCINPAHLYEATNQQNHLDGGKRKRMNGQTKTHCKHGHEFTPENTFIDQRPGGGSSRQCLECNRIRCRRRYAESPELRERVRLNKQKRLARLKAEGKPQSYTPKYVDQLRAALVDISIAENLERARRLAISALGDSAEKASGEPTDAEKRAMGVDLDSRDHEAR